MRDMNTSTAPLLQRMLNLVALLSALCAGAMAQGTEPPKFTSDEIVLAVLCMITGLYLCFAGYRIVKVLLFLTGFYVGYWLCYSIMTGIDVDYGENEEWIIFGSSVGAGLLVGLVLLCLMQLGIFLLGCLWGFMLALWILSFVDPNSPLITEPAYKWLFIGGISLVTGILALVFQKPIIIIASSYVGSYILFYGIDVFAQTGFYDAAQRIIRGEKPVVDQCGDSCIIMLCACVVTCVLGIIVQFATNRNRNHNDEKTSNGNVYIKIN